ncbi:MAG: response regulator [Sedimentisphaerales bacterium]|nr:response regulator [Sedimentisphaerales bacterium]
MKAFVSLNQKIMWSIIGVIILSLIAILIVSKTIVLKGFAELEEKQIEINIKRTEKSIEAELADLAKLCGDWAPWDGARDFMLGKDPNFVISDLSENTIANLNINFIIFTDKSGKIYCIKEIDLEKEEFIEPYPVMVENILSNNLLLTMTEPEDNKSGFIVLPDRIAMIAAQPISSSAAQKPISGTLIMGRYLDERVLSALSEKTQLDIRLANNNTDNGNNSKSLGLLSSGAVEGYLNIPDLTGDKKFTIKMVMPRSIYNSGLETISYFISAIFLCGSIILTTLMFLIQKIFLGPIDKLTEKYADIDLKCDTDTKLYTDREDEIGRLAKSFNRLIEMLKNKLTEREMTEKSLVLAKKQAEDANQAKGQFLANMSHEIRTPMNAIMGFCQILNDENLTDEQREYVNIIHEGSKHLLQVINDILDFSKIEAGKMDIELSPCSVARLFGTVESMMRPAALEKALKFEIRQKENLPANIITDSARLQQCLINLVNNAIKFTEKGHVYIFVSLEERKNKPFIRFDIEDTGIGIPAEKHKMLFKAFTQVDGSHSRKYGGSGLGLSITRQLAELLGGGVSAKSEEGKGSVFSLVIPAGIDVTKEPVLEKRLNTKQLRDAKNKELEGLKFSGNILVAEDVKTNQMLTTSLLNKLGLEVTIASDGIEAVEKAFANKYDLIFMDIQMPNLDGYEAVTILRKEGVKTPIIAMTAHAMKGDAQKCIDAGCNDYLSKPIDRFLIAEKIKKYLSSEAQILNADADSLPSPVETEPAQLQTEELSKSDCDTNHQESTSEINEIINWERLIERFGDVALIEEILPTYLADSRAHFEKLSEAMKTNDSKEIKFHAHAIKGAGRNLSVQQLTDIAANLEHSCSEGDIEKVTGFFNELKPEFEKVMSFISQPEFLQKVREHSAQMQEAGKL